MNEQDLDYIAERLAPKLIEQVRESKQDFWIDPEEHYNSHKDSDRVGGLLTDDNFSSLSSLIKLYNLTTGLFAKAFIGLAIVGAMAFAFFGFIAKKIG